MFGCNVWVYELKIIKLLMLNFTCLWCIYMYTCVLPINDEEWIVVDWCCCCCCYEVLLLMIHTLGVHNFGFVVWIELLLRVFVKMGWIVLKWNSISCLRCFWKPFWVHEPVNNLWKHIWVLRNQNWKFWVKKGWNPKVFLHNWWLFALANSKRAVSEQP